MKSKFFAPLLTIGAFLMLTSNEMNVLASSGYGGGSGTQNDPYLISTPEHLNQLQLDVNVNGVNTLGKYYRLTADIDLSGYDNDSDETNGNFTPIGNSSSLSFKGTFDGNGKVISNLEIVLPERDYVGLFGYTSSATVQGIGGENVLIEGKGNVGGLIGYQTNGTITKSYAIGDVVGSGSYVGGLVGYQYDGTISQSYMTGSVSGNDRVGGLIGNQAGGTISQSYMTGSVSASKYYVGGLVGNGYNTTNITNSYWDIETTGQSSSSNGGYPVLTKGLTTSLAYDVLVGFDFENVWMLCEGELPQLRWEKQVCQEVARPTHVLEGDGTNDNPHLIKTEEDLLYVNQLINTGGAKHGSYYSLNANLDMVNFDTDTEASNGNWVPMGSSLLPFEGTFDGNGKVISNLEIILPNQGYVGLFGYAKKATIQDLGLESVNIEGSSRTGGLVGYAYDTNTQRSYVTGDIVGSSDVGGLVGYHYYGAITQSYAAGTVSGSSDVGGLVGETSYDVIVRQSYSMCDVTGSSYSGGLIGNFGSKGVIDESYSTGSVGGSGTLGGLIGNGSGVAKNSYWDVETSGRSSSKIGNPIRTKGLTTSLAYDVLVGFDFENVWMLCEGELPQLRWEKQVCQEVARPTHVLEGDGTNDNPHLIKTEEDLLYVNQLINTGGAKHGSYYSLNANLDMVNFDTDTEASNGNWVPMGSELIPFKGTFYGNGYQISNIEILLPSENYVGFFGYADPAIIQDLGLIELLIEGNNNVGGLAGYVHYKSVYRSYTTGVVNGEQYVGGLVGYFNYGGTFSQNKSSTTVNGTKYVGGLIGYGYGMDILDSYATGNVSGTSYVGGLMGGGGNAPEIIQSYSTAIVSGSSTIGGLTNSYVNATNSYWDIESSGRSSSHSGKPVRTVGLTTSLAYGVLSGFDFENIWILCEGELPQLRWEKQFCQEVDRSEFRLEGDGTVESPYLISTPEDLIYVSDLVYAGGQAAYSNFSLTTSLDMSDYDNDSDQSNGNWKPIGDYGIPFKGVFEGNGNLVSNISVLQPKSYLGFFGNIYEGTLQNLGVENIVIEGGSYVGGLVGCMGTKSVVSKSYAVGEIKGEQYVGGLVGYQIGEIDESYARVDSDGSKYVGGLVGYQSGSSSQVNRSYSTGKVSGSSYLGGLVAYKYGKVVDSYWDIESSGRRSSNGGTGLSTNQMTKRKAKENMVGFDFETVWQESNGYPLLRWQPADPIREEDIMVNGFFEATILSLTVPTNSISFVLNPNEEVGKQFVASGFELTNESRAPLMIELRAFEQVTNVLTDVEPTKYSEWTGLNKAQSKDIALALVPKTGNGWLTLNEGNRWVADLGEVSIGTIKGNSTISFGFEAKHGSSFTETLTPQYKLTFVFGLQD